MFLLIVDIIMSRKKYYCRPIKLYVCIICQTQEDSFKALLFGYTNGVKLFDLTMPFPSGRNRCAYVNNKDYPWICDWLVENGIANPTYRSYKENGFNYKEFKFRKEI